MKYNEEYEKQWGKGPHIAADAVVLYGMRVLLIKRQDGQFALPGGFVEPNETLLDASIRETREETTLKLSARWLVHSEKFDNPARDMRSRIISFAHLFVVPHNSQNPKTAPLVKGKSDAKHAFWHPMSCMSGLPMYADHSEMYHKMVYRHV